MAAGFDSEKSEAAFKRVAEAFETLVGLHARGQEELRDCNQRDAHRAEHLQKYLEVCKEWNDAYRVYLDAMKGLHRVVLRRSKPATEPSLRSLSSARHITSSSSPKP